MNRAAAVLLVLVGLAGYLIATDVHAYSREYVARAMSWAAQASRPSCEAQLVACLDRRSTCDVMITCGNASTRSAAIVRIACDTPVCQSFVDVRY